MNHRRVASAAVLVAALLTGSCNPTAYTLSGRVQFRDGRPLTAGQVVAEAAGANVGSGGMLGPDGSFRLSERLPAGKYVVYIVAARDAEEPAKYPDGRPLIHRRYENPASSGFEVELGPKTQAVVLTVEPPGR